MADHLGDFGLANPHVAGEHEERSPVRKGVDRGDDLTVRGHAPLLDHGRVQQRDGICYQAVDQVVQAHESGQPGLCRRVRELLGAGEQPFTTLDHDQLLKTARCNPTPPAA